MRVALISDQHGNDLAFGKVTEDIERIGVERIVCLGDVVQGGAQPAETLDRLKSLECETVLGNADAFLLGREVFEEPPPEHLELRDWTLGQLDQRQLEQIRSFEATVRVEVEGCVLLCFHGSPSSYDDILLPDSDDLEPWLADADLLAGGHTHTQWVRRIGGALFVNPGSVGLAWDRHRPPEERRLEPVSEWALITVGTAGPAVELRRVPYSVDELRETISSSGRPHADEHAAMYAPR